MSVPPNLEGSQPNLYPLMEELDRLEDLLEEMDDLEVTSRRDVERRLAELHDEVSRMTGETVSQEP